MEASLLSSPSDKTRQQNLPYGKHHHHHVPKVFALPDTTPEKQEESRSEQHQPQCGHEVSNSMIQLVRRGEGEDRMTMSNFVAKDGKDKTEKELSLHRPILVRDAPESIGMIIPKGRSMSRKKQAKQPIANTESSKKRKRQMPTPAPNMHGNISGETSNSVAFSVRDVADAVGHSSPVQVINVLSQELEENLADWTFHDLVEYFEDKERLTRNKTTTRETPPLPVSPTTGRSRRKAAIKSEKCFSAIIHEEKSSGEASKRILNQISFEFSGTSLYSMVRSPKLVRDIDWIDQAWPAERKPECNKRSSQNNAHRKENNNKNNNETPKKASKGNNLLEYPVVQYYCLTSSAGSYTDFHIDFGGSSVWYHIVRGQKIFVVSPPTSHNLRVYEEWLCHPDQAIIFFPDLMRERACPDIHCYSTSDAFSSAPSVSTHSSASPSTTYASTTGLRDLAEEMAFIQNSPKNTLSTSNSLRFTLNAGETLILPAGWIHSVYTPVDSLVFGGNFLHGLDIQKQLAVNNLEARSRVLSQYRFPHFGALQMYAGGMYLKRLRSMRKEEAKPKVVVGNCDMGTHSTRIRSDEQEEGKEQQENNAKPDQESSDSNESISLRELEELPMLMNAIEDWWQSEQDLDKNGVKIENVEKKTDARDSRTMDSIKDHDSFRDAAVYVIKENSCESVEDFIATFRKEYARVSNEQWGSFRVAPSDDPTGQFGSFSSIPIAIGKSKKKSRKKNQEGSAKQDDPLDVVLSKEVKKCIVSFQNEKKKAKPRRKKDKRGTTELDDPLDVVLSKEVKEYLATIEITTAAQLLLAKTSDVARYLPEWRKKKGMAELRGRAGSAASVSVWKRKVRLRAALVGAKKLAELNQGTNIKPLGLTDEDDRKPPPPNHCVK